MSGFKIILSEHKKFFAGLLALAVLIPVLWLLIEEDIKQLWPDNGWIELETANLKKQRKKLELELEESARLKSRRDAFLGQSGNFWVGERDGNIETDIHRKIEDAASSANIKLSSLGSLKSSKISDGIVLMELNVTASAKLDALVAFLGELERMKPRMSWQRCTIRPENPRSPGLIFISGNIQFVCVNDKALVEILLGKKK
jgi:hypothetical protein